MGKIRLALLATFLAGVLAPAAAAAPAGPPTPNVHSVGP
jgi:hypothetical protein